MADDAVPADATRIWRYLRLSAFLELIAGALMLTRVDGFEDAAEGAYGRDGIRFTPDALARIGVAPGVSNDEAIRAARRHVAVSAWYAHDFESYSMWSVYGRMREAVAVGATVGALRSLFAGDDAARIERVRYARPAGDVDDPREPFFYKREQFRDEREIRVVRWFRRPAERIVPRPLTDLNALVDLVVVAPGSRASFRAAVEHALRAACGPQAPWRGEVRGSLLDDDLLLQDEAPPE